MTIRRFIFTWLIVALTFVVGAATVSGVDSIDGSLDFFGGLGSVGILFGGLSSFFGVILALAAIAFVILGLNYMTNRHYADDEQRLRAFHIFSGVFVVVFAAWIGLTWINMPTGSGWLGVLFLVIITAATVAVMMIHRKPLLPTRSTI